jgi:hypothetical protein
MIQLVVLKRIDSSIYFEPRQKPGNVVWVNTEAIARELIDAGLCRLPELPKNLQEPPDAKKFSGGAVAGLSTASPLSKESGKARLSSVSAADLVLRRRL